MTNCLYCGKEFSKKGLNGHTAFCSMNPDKKDNWNKGKTKDTDIRLAALSATMTGKKRPNFIPWWKGVKGDPRLNGKAHTEEKEVERCNKLRAAAIKNNAGGRIEGSGRGKKGWYKGFFCDSSWELAFLVYHLDFDKTIARCTEVRTYYWEGKLRRYYPDFVVDDKIIEIKGYKTPQWEAKLAAHPDIVSLYADDIKPYLEYVISKYGKDFIKLYEIKKGS